MFFCNTHSPLLLMTLLKTINTRLLPPLVTHPPRLRAQPARFKDRLLERAQLIDLSPKASPFLSHPQLQLPTPVLWITAAHSSIKYASTGPRKQLQRQSLSGAALNPFPPTSKTNTCLSTLPLSWHPHHRYLRHRLHSLPYSAHVVSKRAEKWKKSLHNYLRCFPLQRDVDLKLSGMLVCVRGGEGSVSPESGDRHCPLAVSPRNVFFTLLCTSIHSPLPLTCFTATLLVVVVEVEGLLCCFLCMLHSCRLLLSPSI